MTQYSRAILFIFSSAMLFCSCKKDVLEPQETQQINVPATHDLNSILFVNDTLGFIAGGEKYTSTELLTTTDGGKTWNRFVLEKSDSKGVYGLAYNGRNIFAVGYDGKIYKPNENQDGWNVMQTPNWEWYQDIAFSEPNRGFIISGEGYRAGRLYHTDSLGTMSLIDTFDFQLVDVQFATPQIGYIAGYGAALKTVDGGDSWQLLDVRGDFFRSVSCVDQNNIWMAGYNGTIVHTADGGTTWDKQRNGDNPLLKKYRFRAVVFKDLHTGYAAGDKGLLVKTTDGGAHWSEFKSFTDKDLKCMTLHPDGSIWVAGTDGTVFHIRE